MDSPVVFVCGIAGPKQMERTGDETFFGYITGNQFFVLRLL